MNTRQSGFTMVELMVAISVIVIGVLGLTAGVSSAANISRTSTVNDLGRVATQNLLSQLESHAFDQVVADFGVGSGQEAFWCTEDGNLLFTDPGNALIDGTIEVFDDESSIPSDFEGLDGGFDLNGDGQINGVVTDYMILPVRISMTVNVPDDSRNISACLLLGARQSD